MPDDLDDDELVSIRVRTARAHGVLKFCEPMPQCAHSVCQRDHEAFVYCPHCGAWRAGDGRWRYGGTKPARPEWM